MIKSPIVNPTPIKGWVSRQFGLGNACYDLDADYSPDTGYGQSVVLDLASPKFEPNKSYIFDRSRFNNHGTITGATWTRLPSGLWVLNFDGTDDLVDLASNLATITKSADFSIGLWINPANVAPTQIICANTNAADDRFELVIDANTIVADIWNGVAFITKVEAAITTGWHRVLYTFATAGSVGTIYVDGVASTTVAHDAGWNSSTVGFRIGENTGGTGDYQGYMGLASVLSRVKSPAEETNSFNQERHLFGV